MYLGRKREVSSPKFRSQNRLGAKKIGVGTVLWIQFVTFVTIIRKYGRVQFNYNYLGEQLELEA